MERQRYVGWLKRMRDIFGKMNFEEKEISRDYLQNGSLCCCLFVDILVPVPETTLKFENITVKLTEIN